MEPDHLDFTFPTGSYELIESMNDNCRNVERLALDILCAQHLPVVNTLRTLTKQECWMILKKYRNCFNVLEQAVFLCAVTDYVTCACENSELFNTFRKKQDRDGIPALLLHLQNDWIKFLTRLKTKDLSLVQLTSMIFLLRKSVERLSGRNYKYYFVDVLKMVDMCLSRFKNDSENSTGQNCSNWILSTSSREISKLNSEDIVRVHVNNDNKTKFFKKKDIPRKCERWNDDVEIENRCMPLVQNKSPAKKFTSDITKYLKACDNKQSSQVTKNEKTAITEKKDVQEESLRDRLSDTVLSPETVEQHAERIPPTKSVIRDVNSPVKQMPCSDETAMTDGKVNAFVLMMRQSKLRK